MKFGFTIRVPVGVVAAIAPFNFPLNLVAHKVGPAIAAGNSVVIKPASDTPLSSLKLTEAFLEAGLPPEAIQCVTGSGASIGDALVSHPAVRKVTFTGSQEVGEHIMHTAGLKKVTMELGSNSPLIVLPDADMDKVTDATVQSGYLERRSGLHIHATGHRRPIDIRRFPRRAGPEGRGFVCRKS